MERHLTPAESSNNTPQAPSGSYQELSPHEFNARKDMLVIVIKSGPVQDQFEGFEQVMSMEDGRAVLQYAAQGHLHQKVIGLVCPDGGCSSRLAIRLSRDGHEVYHLAGGLHEWYQCYPGHA